MTVSMVKKTDPIKVGDVVTLELPYSEVCMFLGVAGQTRSIRVTEHGAQILNEDGSNFSYPVTHGEAGLITDYETRTFRRFL
ncbi:hypothetical protein [Streptomyces ardesiacus]|uniref:hypothetical protein n=1 Tax=Streptomyces ardesiacus TaxID=285564 RepID=UPI00382FBE3A